MAGRRHHRSGTRYRSAAQRAALVKAQKVSAQKRRRNKRVAIGLAGGVALAGIAYGGRKGTTRIRAKASAYPYARQNMRDWEFGDKLSETKKVVGKEFKIERKRVTRLKNRAELIKRNKARRQTPEQRAESSKRRSAYLADYNGRRREAYRAANPPGRPRKPRAKETKPRKRKTD